MNNAIIHTEFRQSITFTETPDVGTTRELRKLGFDYDRRNCQWFRANRTGTHADEQSVVKQLVD